MDRPAGAEAGADNGDRLGKLGRRKNTNEIITIRDRKDMLYAGLDVHRNTIQVAVLDWNGKILTNEKIPHMPEAVREMTGRLPEHTKYVMESSLVWEGTYRLMTEEMKLDVTLSNPRTTLLIAKSKTDKVDAVVLADMHRGGYIAACYVPDIKTMCERKLGRHRYSLGRKRTNYKISIHGILHQLNFRSDAVYFSTARTYHVRALKNYRINDQFTQIAVYDSLVKANGSRVREAVKNNRYA